MPMEIYHRIFESSPDALLVIDPAGRITLVNARAEALFGYERVDMIGQAIEMLIPPRYRTDHVSHRMNYLGAPHSRPMGEGAALFGQRKGGDEFAVDVMLSPLHVEKGLFILCIVRSLSERRPSK